MVSISNPRLALVGWPACGRDGAEAHVFGETPRIVDLNHDRNDRMVAELYLSEQRIRLAIVAAGLSLAPAILRCPGAESLSY